MTDQSNGGLVAVPLAQSDELARTFGEAFVPVMCVMRFVEMGETWSWRG